MRLSQQISVVIVLRTTLMACIVQKSNQQQDSAALEMLIQLRLTVTQYQRRE